MTDQEQLAYSALDRWEREGEYPDDEEFNAIVAEWRKLLQVARRFELLVDECQYAEHLRRSVKNGNASGDYSTDGEAETATDPE